MLTISRFALCALAMASIGSSFGCGDASDSTSPEASTLAREPSARIVFRSEEGRVLRLDELPSRDESFTWQIVAGEEIPERAEQLHARARDAGATGNYDGALDLLDQAAKAAPGWPYPLYDKAFTYLLKGEHDEALQYYRATLKLSPRGFFTAITAEHYLAREAAGALPKGTYFEYLSLEWIQDDAQQHEAARALTESVPGFAPAWNEYALGLSDVEARARALDAGLAAEPDAETRGFLLINKALLLWSQSQAEKATRILGTLALDDNGPLDVQHAARSALAVLASEPER